MTTLRQRLTQVDPLRHLWWHRRFLAAVAAGLAVFSLGSALSPATGPTVDVLVARHEVVSGTRLTESDVETRAVPADLVPDGASRPGEQTPVGRTVAATLTRGSILTRTSVVSSSLAAAPGRVLATVRVTEPALVAMLRVGDAVDVLAAGSPSALATGARVVSLPGAQGGGGLGSAGSASGAIVVLQVLREEAQRLAEVGRAGDVTVVLTRD